MQFKSWYNTLIHAIYLATKPEETSMPSHLTNRSSVSTENHRLSSNGGQSNSKTDPEQIASNPLTSSTSIRTSPTSYEQFALDVSTGQKSKLTCKLQMIWKNIKHYPYQYL